jgi:hypothetical protein
MSFSFGLLVSIDVFFLVGLEDVENISVVVFFLSVLRIQQFQGDCSNGDRE